MITRNSNGFLSIILIFILNTLLLYTIRQYEITQAVTEMIQYQKNKVVQSYIIKSVADYLYVYCRSHYNQICNNMLSSELIIDKWACLQMHQHIVVRMNHKERDIYVSIALHQKAELLEQALYRITHNKDKKYFSIEWIE